MREPVGEQTHAAGKVFIVSIRRGGNQIQDLGERIKVDSLDTYDLKSVGGWDGKKKKLEEKEKKTINCPFRMETPHVKGGGTRSATLTT